MTLSSPLKYTLPKASYHAEYRSKMMLIELPDIRGTAELHVSRTD